MFLQVSLTQFDCARSFIRLSPGMSLNFNFAIDFKNKIEYVNNKVSEEEITDMIISAVGRVQSNKKASGDAKYA